jgi:3'-phosphoadenosine 5'-phosphosulfate sulfotransferase (PAPS reductase)/FAD synthetase
MTPLEPTSAFRVEGPALISFSGGRTSAYMLWRILEAFGGHLPPDIVPVFENTGKEREETLRFVHECATRWEVPVRWLEWRPRPQEVENRPTFRAWFDAKPERWELLSESGFAEVGFNSASRHGEPFEALIASRQFAPNPVMRFCSVVLKVRAACYFAQQTLGWDHWTNLVGLRHDEGHRIFKMLARNDSNKEPWKAKAPLGNAKITKRDVLAFWWGEGRNFDTRQPPQGFDLGLRDYEGNCDLCFLKSREKKVTIIREHPEFADWWIQAEQLAKQHSTGAGGQFRSEYSYAEIAEDARRQGVFDFGSVDDDHDVECGLICEPDPELEPLAAAQ